MSITTVLFSAMLLTSLTFAVSIAHGLRTRQATPGGRPAVAFLIALILWLFGRLMEDAVPEIGAKLFWAKIEYFGIATVPVFWLLFALEYTRRLRLPWPPRTWLLFVVPVLTIGAVWTNDAHRWLWSSVVRSSENPNVLVYSHGPWFYTALVYNYALVLLGSITLVRHALARTSLHRNDSIMLAVGACLPLTANVIYVLGLSPIKGLDLTPFGLTLAVTLWATSKLRDRVLDIVPARDALLGHLADAVIIVDDLGLVTDMNPAARTLLALTQIPDDFSWEGLLRDRLSLDAAHAVPLELRTEVTLKQADELRSFELAASPVFERKRYVGRIAFLRDITERKHNEKQSQELNMTLERQVVERTNQLATTVDSLKREVAERRQAEIALHQLSDRLATLQENERASIARELHDQVGANLSALGMSLSLVRFMLPAQTPEKALNSLSDANKLLRETTEIVRGIMAELRPPLLDDYGLLSALRWLASQWQARTGVTVVVDGVEPRLTPEARIALFRIAQEALNNVARHANAAHARLELRIDDSCRLAVLDITDDGAGFLTQTLTQTASDSKSGWGMGTMRERARSVHGSLQIESTPGRGTTIRAIVPCDLEVEAAAFGLSTALH
jgi:signal transduction histidine kinase